ncbi:MAG: glucuronate isomerase [Acidobacteriota bacterium]
MVTKTLLHEDRLFPSEPMQRSIARRLYSEVRNLPVISPHGHTDPRWFAENVPFTDPATLLVIPDHYVFRMLYSQGVSLESLGIPRTDGKQVETDPKKIWDLFARYFYLFRATPTQLWFHHVLEEVFGIAEPLNPESAERSYARIAACLESPDYLPRRLYERFNIEVLATTDSPLDSLSYHRKLRQSGWKGCLVPTFRPDPVADPDFPGFANNVERLGDLTKEETTTWTGYLKALATRRQYFIELGATATDHGHPTSATFDLSKVRCEALLQKALSGSATPVEAEEFRGQLLTEMARMSIEDGLVMQIHPGSYRDHNPALFQQFGRDKGADMPTRTDYVRGLKPLLDLYGNDRRLSVILFTLDESTYSRELAPMAGHYPALKLGPAWWFYDSPEGMRFYRERTTETAGFYNTVGFNDDTRAFPSIPARHDIARRADCSFLAKLVSEHRLEEEEALEIAIDLTYRLPKKAYRLQ